MTDADAPTGRVGVVVVAGGAGTRLGAAEPKAFVPLAGRPVLAYAVEQVARIPGLVGVALVVPASHADPLVLSDCGVPLSDRTLVVTGGAERTDSVRHGIAALDAAVARHGWEAADVLLVHDAARCLTPLAVFERIITAVLAGSPGAVPGLAVVDTIKSVDADGFITGTPDRGRLRAVQTPQGFAAEVLRAAYASGLTATDDAALVELAGHAVRVVEGDPLAFKITTPEDLARAERVLAEWAVAESVGEQRVRH